MLSALHGVRRIRLRKEKFLMKLGKLLKKCTMLLLSGALLLSSCEVTDNTSSDPSGSGDASGAVADRKHTLVSLGKPYKTSIESNPSYTDLFGSQLTDGQKTPDFGTFYTDIRMVGFTGNCRIDIDLGDDGKRLSAVSVRSLDVSQDGVLLASGAVIYGSDDGKSWSSIAHSSFKSSGDRSVSVLWLEFDELQDFRYIRVSMTIRSGSAFYFTDEIEVYADIPEKTAVATVAASYESESIDRNAWKAVSTGTKVNPAATNNVAYGCAYTFANAEEDPRAKQAYDTAKNMPKNTVKPPFNTMLTDGARTGRMFGERVWNAVKATGGPSVTLDLGEIRNDLFSFRLHMLGAGHEVEFPVYVDVYASDNGKDFTFLGRMYAPNGGSNFAYTLILPEYIHAGYIRFDLPKGKTNYWMEEIEIFAGLDTQPDDEFYPPVTYPVVTEELTWPSSEADYSVRKNLLLGRQQQVAASFYNAPETMANEKPQTKWDAKILTDGEEAPDMYCYSDGWFFHRGGGAIDFFFDLERLSSIDSVVISFLEQKDWGIHHPRHITVLLSEDANNWYPVKLDTPTGDSSAAAKRIRYEIKLDETYAARFVRIRVESAVLFIDEIEAYGTKRVSADAKRLADSGVSPVIYYTNENDKKYCGTETTPVKASDIMLVYGEKGDENALLPLVAHLDAEGNITDTFMDGFLYCPTGALPSGNAAHRGTLKVDWDFLFDNTFNGVNGFNRLEEVVEQVKSELKKPDYKVQVYITILYPLHTVTDFGDVDGDGVTESLETEEGRRKVLDWYINRCLDEFNKRGYKNLELGGFYWINEAVTWEEDDTALIKEISEAVHDANSYLLWIPYYNAHRAFLGYELGFDLVCMQPNYAFTLDKPLYQFTATARRMKTMHMCIEIENSFQSMSDPLYARSYMLYLYYGAVTGYMKDTVHIYYDDINNFSTMAYSDSKISRMQYDATYEFVKGTLNVTPEKRDDVTLEAKANTVLDGTLSDGDPLTMYTLVTAPEHGYVSLSEDGSIAYYPEKGYTGSDSFTYTYNKFLGESEPCTVNINIA